MTTEGFRVKYNNGQSLIEVLVAFSAIIIVLSAITAIVISSLNQAAGAKNASKATQYAQEGLEQMKLITLPGNDGTYCLQNNQPTTGTCGSGALIDGTFRRTVVIQTGSCAPLREVRVDVAWTDGKCRDTPFCNIRPVTTCL